jgi:hypothetical protein
MPVDPLDKPIARLREETIDQLTLNYSHGELSLEAFKRRLDQALDAETHNSLLSLTKDLDLVVDSTFMEHKKRELSFMTDSNAAVNEKKIINIFGSSNRQGTWDVPDEIGVLNILGDTTLDFDEAKFTSMTTRINVSSIFGSLKIYVPEGVNIISNVSCILANVKDKASYGKDADEPTIILDGFILFSDIKIKLKKTFRMRLLEFAETVKAVLA